jgi:hypothetical protein
MPVRLLLQMFFIARMYNYALPDRLLPAKVTL